MKCNNSNFEGDLIAATAVYSIRDNRSLKNLVLSQTILHVAQQTRGHHHEGQEEVYFFVHGQGKMIVGEETFDVTAGDIVTIPDGLFHRVINTGESDLVFNCVFDGRRNH